MNTSEELKARAAEIRDAEQAGENTAHRVGSLLCDLVDLLVGEGDIEEAVITATQRLISGGTIEGSGNLQVGGNATIEGNTSTTNFSTTNFTTSVINLLRNNAAAVYLQQQNGGVRIVDLNNDKIVFIPTTENGVVALVHNFYDKAAADGRFAALNGNTAQDFVTRKLTAHGKVEAKEDVEVASGKRLALKNTGGEIDIQSTFIEGGFAGLALVDSATGKILQIPTDRNGKMALLSDINDRIKILGDFSTANELDAAIANEATASACIMIGHVLNQGGYKSAGTIAFSLPYATGQYGGFFQGCFTDAGGRTGFKTRIVTKNSDGTRSYDTWA